MDHRVPAVNAADAATVVAWGRADRQPAVLVVDDEQEIRETLERLLQRHGYRVATACCADEAVARMKEEPIAVALCDIRMPGRDGLWLLSHVRDHFPETAIVMLTGVHDAGPAIASLRRGVVDYLTKPFEAGQLEDAVRRAMEWHVSLCSERRWAAELEDEACERERRLQGTIGSLAIHSDEAVDALLSTLYMQNPGAYTHARRVASLAVLLSDSLGRPEREKRTIRRAALLHDLGKYALPPAVVDKPAPLTGEEYELVRTHPARAHRLLAPIPFLGEAALLVRAVHERPDGCGFPDGIDAARIPLGGSVIGIANAYDAMISTRPYREAVAAAEALAQLERGAGAQFDATLVPVFVALLRGSESR